MHSNLRALARSVRTSDVDGPETSRFKLFLELHFNAESFFVDLILLAVAIPFLRVTVGGGVMKRIIAEKLASHSALPTRSSEQIGHVISVSLRSEAEKLTSRVGKL